jgi:hypothetical protein
MLIEIPWTVTGVTVVYCQVGYSLSAAVPMMVGLFAFVAAVKDHVQC